MKKNKMMRLAAVLLVAVLMTTCAISGTFAKYITTGEGQDTARVAKWAWTIDDKDFGNGGVAFSNTIEFDLFNTINDSDAATPETDVAANLIAPGTSGSFSFVVRNNSEVNAKYSITYTVTSSGSTVPLVFTGMDNVTEEAINMGAEETINIDWVWDFAGDHTDLGVEAPTVTVQATITFEQVD